MATKHITLTQAAEHLRQIIAGADEHHRSARKAQMLFCAEVGSDYSWSESDLEKDGSGKQFITAMLEKALGKTASPSELSKHIGFARPKCRVVAGDLFDTAVKMRAEAVDSKGEKIFRSEDRALEKLLSQFKLPDVSTVETARQLALVDAKAAANKVETVEAQRSAAVKRVRSAINSLAGYFTPESIAALVAGLGSLEIKLPEQAEPEEVEPEQAAPAAFDINAILNSMTVDEKIKAIAALQVTK